VVRDLPALNRPDLAECRKKLSPVPWLDGVKPRHPVRDIFHKPAADLVSAHLLKADGTAGDPEPVCTVGPERERSCGADDGE